MQRAAASRGSSIIDRKEPARTALKLALARAFDRTRVAQEMDDGDYTPRLQPLRNDVGNRQFSSGQRTERGHDGVEMSLVLVTHRPQKRNERCGRRGGCESDDETTEAREFALGRERQPLAHGRKIEMYGV